MRFSSFGTDSLIPQKRLLRLVFVDMNAGERSLSVVTLTVPESSEGLLLTQDVLPRIPS
jgi:hypothetical protein